MKILLGIFLLTSSTAFANLCDRYSPSSEKGMALEALASQISKPLEDICNSERILDIEIQPSQIIVQGVAIPHWAIYFHHNEDSCKYMLNRADLTLTSSRCFPTW